MHNSHSLALEELVAGVTISPVGGLVPALHVDTKLAFSSSLFFHACIASRIASSIFFLICKNELRTALPVNFTVSLLVPLLHKGLLCIEVAILEKLEVLLFH